MCNTRTITYSCTHTIPFRLSTCRGTYTYKTRKHPTGVLPLCHSGPHLTFLSPQPCGACAQAHEESQLEHKISNLRLHQASLSEPSEELATAEAKYESDKWRLMKTYPDQARFKKDVRPEKGPRATRSGSLLSREVMAEEVVVKVEVNKTALKGGWDYESWGDGWMDLGEEIAERDAERVAADLPAFTDCEFDCGDEGKESGEEEEEMPEEEVYTVMDWGTATTGGFEFEDHEVLKGEDGKDSVREGKVPAGQEQSASPLEPQTQPIATIFKENETPNPKENKTPTCLWAPRRRRSSNLKQRPQQTPTPKDLETLRSCGLFFMELVVSN